MALQIKYQQLIEAAQSAHVRGLSIKENDGVLYISGTALSETTKNALWDIYGKLDPNFSGGDLILDIDVVPAATGAKVKIVTKSSNLNIRKGPSTNDPVIGKAAHQEIVTLVSQANDQWWIIRTNAGVEGYAYTKYLQLV